MIVGFKVFALITFERVKVIEFNTIGTLKIRIF